MTKELEVQTRNALEFVEKLYFEISYLIKEVEGILQGEEEEFVICRPSGYAVTSRTSAGLEPVNVEMWLPKAFSVFFVESDKTKYNKGMTITSFAKDLKIIVLHVELIGRHVSMPRVIAGCIWNIQAKQPTRHKKFENLIWEFSYKPSKIFSSLPEVNYEDSYTAFQGEFIEEPLFSIKNSDAVIEQIVEPILCIYRR